MSSFKNNRVVIASLFLPTTAVLGESVPSTPDHTSRHVEPRLPTTPMSLGPLKSIVEDLRDKSSRIVTPALASPRNESINPFTKLARISNDTVAGAIEGLTSTSPPPTSRKYQTTHTDHQHITSRIQRKHSRSSSRRPSDSTPSSRESRWHIESNPHCNGGLKNAIASVDSKLKKKLWVGTFGSNTDAFGEGLRSNIDRRMMFECDSLPVWIPDAEFESCYDEFCHQVLWPCLHYAIPDAPKTKLFYESASFHQYKAVNQRFADAIIANYKEGDIIWVNDYHLMLLPALLRASPLLPPNVPIGFFMHVAFPSSEIFRCLSVRQDLLTGVLAADLVGFQTANYARHFRQTVSRIMAFEALPKGIQVTEGGKGRFVDVGVFPMGIDVGRLEEKKCEPDVKEWVQVLTQRYAGMKLVVGRDKLDEIQGVRQKIQAFEVFLEKHPEFQQKVVLIQVALQTTESNELAGGVSDAVSRINSRFSTLTYQPVVFLHTQDLTFSQYLALLTVADAFLVTSLREGMALRAHEYVECQEGRYRPLVLSEFTGSYSYSGFRSCIAVNPWDTRGTADAINQALTMKDDEALSRWEDLHNHVITQTAQAFVTTFLTRCMRAHTEHAQAGLTAAAPLDAARLLPRYRHALKRLLLVDFEGALWRGEARAFAVPEDAVEVLRRLAGDRRNEVWVLSGLPVSGVMERVAERVPKVGIVAENGCFIRTRAGRGGKAEWVDMVANFDLTWKTPCVEILNYFTERTPGSSVEERAASVVWRFWTGEADESSDRQWARRQAAEAQNHIFDSLGERYGLRIVPGDNSFLVLPNNVSRSTAVGAILHPGGPARARAPWADQEGGGEGGEVDFVLAVGADEKLLRRVGELEGAETCSTSGRGTCARWGVADGDVVRVLGVFAGGGGGGGL